MSIYFSVQRLLQTAVDYRLVSRDARQYINPCITRMCNVIFKFSHISWNTAHTKFKFYVIIYIIMRESCIRRTSSKRANAENDCDLILIFWVELLNSLYNYWVWHFLVSVNKNKMAGNAIVWFTRTPTLKCTFIIHLHLILADWSNVTAYMSVYILLVYNLYFLFVHNMINR